MKLKISIIFPLLAVTLLLIGCQSEVNSPDRNELLNDQLSYETVNSDLALMKDGGMPLDSAAGVFSIGWNEMFRPFMDSSEVKGMAFAVAFGERETDLPHFKKFGLDMGNVFINYTGNHIEMHKNSENLLEYIPNTEYQFEVTGSEFFAPITISLTSPNALMDITSPANGQVIDPTQDLTINWEGGKEGKVGVRLMPHIKPHRGPHGGHGEPPPSHHPPFDRIIFVILDTNTYTFSAEQIQILLNGIQADGLMSEVSQMDFGEVVHDNGMLHTAMKNGSSVMMRIQQ